MAGKTVEKEIKDAIKAKKIVIGTKTVIRGVKGGTVTSVICSSNCPEGMRKDLNHYASLSKTEIKDFGQDSSRLGELCGKPFNVLVVGIGK